MRCRRLALRGYNPAIDYQNVKIAFRMNAQKEVLSELEWCVGGAELLGRQIPRHPSEVFIDVPFVVQDFFTLPPYLFPPRLLVESVVREEDSTDKECATTGREQTFRYSS